MPTPHSYVPTLRPLCRAVVACLRGHGADPYLCETAFSAMAHLCSNHEENGAEMGLQQATHEVGDLLLNYTAR